MKCYYKYLTNNRQSVMQHLIDENPIIVLDIDWDGNLMGVEYCD